MTYSFLVHRQMLQQYKKFNIFIKTMSEDFYIILDLAVAFTELSGNTVGSEVQVSGSVLWCWILAVISMFSFISMLHRESVIHRHE